MKQWTVAGILALMLCVALPAGAAVWNVTVQNYEFVPTELTIAPGDTVVWTATEGFHNVRHICDPSRFGNSPASAPWTYQFVFNVPRGRYDYVCDVHPEMMIGAINVEGPRTWNVTVQSFSFTPANLTIDRGDTVVWRNISGFHNVHHNALPSLFGNTAASAPWVYKFGFDLPPGSYPYICQIHPSSMQGNITVQNPNDTPPLPAQALVIKQEGMGIMLHWSNLCTGATSYDIYRMTSADDLVGAVLIGTVSGSEFMFMDMDPLAGRAFYFVRGVID